MRNFFSDTVTNRPWAGQGASPKYMQGMCQLEFRPKKKGAKSALYHGFDWF
jgi:hypothetical protein